MSKGNVRRRRSRESERAAALNLQLTPLPGVTIKRAATTFRNVIRRLRRKLGAPKAITAMAHKLGRLVYRMLKFGQASVNKGMEHYEAKFERETRSGTRTNQPTLYG